MIIVSKNTNLFSLCIHVLYIRKRTQGCYLYLFSLIMKKYFRTECCEVWSLFHINHELFPMNNQHAHERALWTHLELACKYKRGVTSGEVQGATWCIYLSRGFLTPTRFQKTQMRVQLLLRVHFWVFQLYFLIQRYVHPANQNILLKISDRDRARLYFERVTSPLFGRVVLVLLDYSWEHYRYAPWSINAWIFFFASRRSSG